MMEFVRTMFTILWHEYTKAILISTGFVEVREKLIGEIVLGVTKV